MDIKKRGIPSGDVSLRELFVMSYVRRFSGARSCKPGSMMSTVMPRASAMAWMVSSVTAYLPASMRLTWVRCSPARSLSCSWLSPASLRSWAIRCPMRSRVACFCSSVIVPYIMMVAIIAMVSLFVRLMVQQCIVCGHSRSRTISDSGRTPLRPSPWCQG